MNKFDTIISKAKALNACNAIDRVTDWASLCGLFFAPQGREFCAANNFPSHADFAAIRKEVEPFSIYVDSGSVIINDNRKEAAFVGDTHATVYITGVDTLRRIVAAHGAFVKVVASQYAVVNVLKFGGAKVKIENADDTAVILNEQYNYANDIH